MSPAKLAEIIGVKLVAQIVGVGVVAGYLFGRGCASCNGGFHKSGHEGAVNRCNCANGSPVSGGQCPNNGAGKCVSCNSGYNLNNGQCVEIDVRACRLNGVIEASCEDIPIFSPLDEIAKAREGVLYDYQWSDIGGIRCPLNKYIFDGPRWYSKV